MTRAAISGGTCCLAVDQGRERAWVEDRGK